MEEWDYMNSCMRRYIDIYAEQEESSISRLRVWLDSAELTESQKAEFMEIMKDLIINASKRTSIEIMDTILSDIKPSFKLDHGGTNYR